MPRCADHVCGRWRPERIASRWNVGFRLNGSWYCSRGCLQTAAHQGLGEPSRTSASAMALPPLRLGVLLRHMGVLTGPQLELALNEQQRTGMRLGAQLRALGLVGEEPILRALAAQAGVSYLQSFDANRARGGSMLPADTVRALGLVPFEFDAITKRLKVVCAAPVPRTAIRALLKLTGWTADAYLVDDLTWEAALEAYEPVGNPRSRVEAVTVSDLSAAAAHVAEAAAFDRSVTMRHVNCDQYTWVRVEGEQVVSDLLVTGVEDRCLAQATAH